MNQEMKRFTGKVAIITGGASGIGLATAERLASEGATIAVVDRDAVSMKAAMRRISDVSTSVLCLEADVRSLEQLRIAFAAANSKFGRVDVIINSAGVIARGNIDETSDEEWRRVLEINLFSIFYSAKIAMPLLRAAGGGAIVNIASIAGGRGLINAPYSAAKGGVISITRQLADELAQDRIRVNSVSPGFTSTPLNQELRAAGAERSWASRIPLGRYGEPAEIAAACAFLASDDAAYITGIDLVVDGGISAVLRPDPVSEDG